MSSFIVWDEMAHICDHLKEGAESASILWSWNFRKCLDPFMVQLDKVLRYNVFKEHKLLGHELALAGFYNESVKLKEVHDGLKVTPVVIFCPQINNNVIEVYEYALAN